MLVLLLYGVQHGGQCMPLMVLNFLIGIWYVLDFILNFSLKYAEELSERKISLLRVKKTDVLRSNVI